MYLLFLSKYLAYVFIWGSFMHNGDGKVLTSCLYPIKYLNESLSSDFLSHNAILLISTLFLVFTYRFFVFMKSAFNDAIFSETNIFLLHFYTMKKKSQNFFFNFLASW